MNIISEQHKKELLEITKNFPADIASLIDYFEEKLQRKIESYKPSQLEDFKFFVMKSFADEINNSKGDNKYIQELLGELQIIWQDLFDAMLEGQHIYTLNIGDKIYSTKLDFTELNQNNMLNTEFSETSLDLNPIETLPNFSSDKHKYKTELAVIQTILNIQNNYILFPKNISLKEPVTIDILNDLLLLGAYTKHNFFILITDQKYILNYRITKNLL
ncbi:hypothetical protein H6P87_01051 [Rickettsia tillamookensis]|uniref:Uncharacterized protein n=1 Tax=Rickettsia tillamookensis TaxID=2761623 RepID=A0A9E6SQW0_9RICK|nr:hypothetical protein [Rickettsia tillamookensis]QQV75491.1 hypothetical protein H6P87_01051 [Rickettsia tillamookensis]